MMTMAQPTRPQDEVIHISPLDRDRNSQLEGSEPCRRNCIRLRPTAIVDFLIIVAVGLTIFVVEFGYIPSGNLGFTCKDPSISHKFRGDTITVTCLLLTAYFGPIVIITIIEVLKEKSFRKVCLGTIWLYYRELLIGVTLVLLITEVIKVIVAEPRPHFIDTCLPDKDCVEGTFVLDYNCTNNAVGRFLKVDSARSFPSGHSSCSIFVGLYCSYLIQKRIPSSHVTRLTKPFLISVCLTWSLLCSLTRITDRRHHWWDVLAGLFLGICGAYYTVTLLHSKEQKDRNSKLSRTSTTTTILSELKNKEHKSAVI